MAIRVKHDPEIIAYLDRLTLVIHGLYLQNKFKTGETNSDFEQGIDACFKMLDRLSKDGKGVE